MKAILSVGTVETHTRHKFRAMVSANREKIRGLRKMSDEFRSLKDAYGRFATGIGVATCIGEDGESVALTINSFASVSLDPALILWSIERRASSFSHFTNASDYAVSILRADQKDLANRFAGYLPPPLQHAETEIWKTGAPILKNRLAGFDCRISDRHQAGDHVIMVGEVLQFDSADGDPLMYFSSNYLDGGTCS